MSKKNLTIAELTKLRSRYKEVTDQLKTLTKEKEMIEETFKRSISPGKEKANIKHQFSLGKSVSYAKVIANLRETYPEIAEAIDKAIENHTKQTERHSFKIKE